MTLRSGKATEMQCGSWPDGTIWSRTCWSSPEPGFHSCTPALVRGGASVGPQPGTEQRKVVLLTRLRRLWMRSQFPSLTSSVDLEGSLCLVDMLLTWLSTSVFNWNDRVGVLSIKIASVFTDCQSGVRWCRTFFPSVSKAELISRLRKLWTCTSCKGRVLLNWFSPITFWVWSRSTTHFSSVGSLEITGRRYSKSFTTTHNCGK